MCMTFDHEYKKIVRLFLCFFKATGKVEILNVKIINDHETNKSKGFRFLIFNFATKVNETIKNLDGAISFSSSLSN